MATLQLDSISMRYGDTTVLHDVSLDVEDGEFLVLVGPSGCGKSTLLRIIAGLLEPTGGEVRLAGERVNEKEPRERDVAMVFQNYALYPHMTVRRNLGFPLKMAGTPKDEIERRVLEAASTLGLEELLGRKPGALSGGQMQRVALGRAIIRNPRVFLFDEPLSNLDAKLRAEMRIEITKLHRRLGITTVYVTHDQAEAMTMGTRIAVLNAGRLEQEGTPLEVFTHPASRFVASFIGSPPMNLLDGERTDEGYRVGDITVRAPGHDGELTLGIRPHEIAVGEGTPLKITHVEHLGTQTLIQCALASGTLTISREGHHAHAAGDTVRVTLPDASLRWFDRRSGAAV